MNKIAAILGGLGGSGALATGTWFVYDTKDLELSKIYEGQWSPIKINPKKISEVSLNPYSGYSCFQKFFGDIKIEKFGSLSGTLSSSTDESKFDTLFKDTASDIYGCALGDGDDFYEVVMMNDDTGFATWYYKTQNNQYKQKSFVLEKEIEGGWEIKLGVWTHTSPTSRKDTNFTNIEKIKERFNNEGGVWSWLFFMNKEIANSSENMQSWESVFKGTSFAFYEPKHKGWNYNFLSGSHAKGKIPRFDKVQDLTNFCYTQAFLKNSQKHKVDKKKLDLYCLAPQ